MKTVNKSVLIQSAIGIEKAENWVGSEKTLAILIGVRKQKLNYWKNYGLIPVDMAIKICVVTKGHVDFAELRPDFVATLKKFNNLGKYKKQ